MLNDHPAMRGKAATITPMQWRQMRAVTVSMARNSEQSPERIEISALASRDFLAFGQVIDPDPDIPGEDIGTGLFWERVIPLDPREAQVGIIRYHPRNPVIEKMERHPHGGQTFVSLSRGRSLLVVAPDAGDRPDMDNLSPFSIPPGGGFRLEAGTWHASPFPPPDRPSRFLMLMRPGTLDAGTEWFALECPRILRAATI
ncbi:MAG: ureidoglycolate lyase [Bacillota bacterium]